MFNLTGNGPLTTPIKNERRIYYPSTTYGTNTTLTSDLVTGDLILQGGYILNTGGFRIYCSSLTLLDASFIRNNGGSSTDYNGGAGAATGSVGGGNSGGAGSLATSGGTVQPTPIASPASVLLGGIGGGGGRGGRGNVIPDDAVDGGIVRFNHYTSNINFGGSADTSIPLQPSFLNSGFAVGNTINNPSSPPLVGLLVAQGGAGGGGGSYPRYGSLGSYVYGNGGGGGGGGGVVFIACTGTISIMHGSFIEALGGNGGSGTTITGGETGGGGGGGGGGGLIISCNSMSIDPDTTGGLHTGVSAAGGAGGAPGSESGADPQPGSYGNIIINTPNGVQIFYSDVLGSVYSTF